MNPDTQTPQLTTAERFLALSQVGNALVSELDEQRLLHLIARTACDLTGATFAAFSLRSIDDDGQPARPAEGSLFHLAAVFGVTPEHEALFRRMPLGGEGLLAPIFRHGVPVLVADALAHLPTASHTPISKEAAQAAALAFAHGQLPSNELSSLGIPHGHPLVRSFLGAPLLDRKGKVRGGLLLGHTEPNQFTEVDKTILLILAGQAAVTLENARLYQLAQLHSLELQKVFNSISDGIALLDRQNKTRRENVAAHQVRRSVLETPKAQQLLAALLPAQSAHTGTEMKERVVQVKNAQDEQLLLQASLIELAHDAIIVRDPYSVIISWNRGAEALYGWTAQEIIGQVTHSLLQTHFPLSRESVDHLLELEGKWEGELVHTRRDGQTVIVESRQVLMRDAAGHSSAILEINRDITARRHLEQIEVVRAQAESHLNLLQLILDELPSCVYLVRGPEARLVLANHAARTVFGAVWTPGQPMREFLAQQSIRIMRPDGRPLEPEQIPELRVVQRGDTVRQFQEVIRHADGTSLPVLVNAMLLEVAPLLDGTEQATSHRIEPERAALVVCQDVTALKEAETLKNEFLTIASHELRSPLAVLSGYTGMLLRQDSRGRGVPLTSWQKEGLQGINKATERLAELMGDLLDVTRLQGKRLDLSSEPTDLIALSKLVVNQQQVTTQRHQLTLHTVHEQLVVNIDTGRLEQIITNLLSNAIKYSPQGGPIEITIEAASEAGEAVLSVRDHGMGIPAEQHARIFGRFVRADNARISAIAGTGLGLYLCRELIERYGGRIWFESSKDEGSTFFVALPIVVKVLL